MKQKSVFSHCTKMLCSCTAKTKFNIFHTTAQLIYSRKAIARNKDCAASEVNYGYVHQLCKLHRASYWQNEMYDSFIFNKFLKNSFKSNFSNKYICRNINNSTSLFFGYFDYFQTPFMINFYILYK
jgi:hypothetical protein